MDNDGRWSCRPQPPSVRSYTRRPEYAERHLGSRALFSLQRPNSVWASKAAPAPVRIAHLLRRWHTEGLPLICHRCVGERQISLQTGGDKHLSFPRQLQTPQRTAQSQMSPKVTRRGLNRPDQHARTVKQKHSTSSYVIQPLAIERRKAALLN